MFLIALESILKRSDYIRSQETEFMSHHLIKVNTDRIQT